jgi:hypothetical protein
LYILLDRTFKLVGLKKTILIKEIFFYFTFSFLFGTKIFPYVYTLAADKLLSYDRKALCFLLHCFGWILFKRFLSYSWDIRLPLTPDADKKAIGKSASLTDAFVDTLGWSTSRTGKSPALVHYDTDTTQCGLCEPMNSMLTDVLAKHWPPSP